MDRLKGKVAVITGANAGIGLATLELFVKEGAYVVAACRNEHKGKEVAARFPNQVIFHKCNVLEEQDIKSAIQSAIDNFGKLDILFNNAGSGGPNNRISDMTSEAWDYSQNLLLRSAALGIRYAVSHMKENGGSIINNASVAGIQSGSSISYSVAKAGLIHLTKLAAAELGRSNIRVNAISPGLIMTEIFTPESKYSKEAAAIVKEARKKRAPYAQPIFKAGIPEYIANACLFLASDESEFITGVNLLVDGGLTTGPNYTWDSDIVLQRKNDLEKEKLEAFEKVKGKKD